MLNLFSIFPKAKGFEQLVRTFEAKEFPEKGKIIKTTVQVGSVRYRRCASILMVEDGFYIRIKYVFKSYPTIFVPKNAIKESKKSKLYGRKAVGFTFFDSNIPSIRFYETDLNGSLQ
jgi:hypothetical protein